MSKYAEGMMVKIPCSIQPGAFTNERLITISTNTTEYSGFIKIDDLVLINESEGFVEGKITLITSDSVTIQFPVSFFTTAAGKTSVDSGWANTHLQAAAG